MLASIRRLLARLSGSGGASAKSTDERSPRLRCESCQAEFRIGKDAVIVSDDYVDKSLANMNIPVVGSRSGRNPDLVLPNSPGTSEDLKGRNALRIYRSIEREVSHGVRRQWHCGKCRALNSYAARSMTPAAEPHSRAGSEGKPTSPSPRATTKDRTEELYRAAESNDSNALEAILAAGQDPNAKGKEDVRALHVAAGEGHLAAVQLLLSHGADPNAPKDTGWTALHSAAVEGHQEIAKALLKAGADVQATASSRITPLHWAAEQGHSDVAKLLLDRDAEVDARSSEGETPLLRAASKGHAAVARLLLERGADPNATNQWNRTPLLWAAEQDWDELATVLLERGADPGVAGGEPPLLWTAATGSEKVAAILLDHGAEVSPSGHDWKPIFEAAVKGHVRIAELLVARGAAVDARDRTGRTPLSYAKESRNEAMMSWLVSHGARE